MVWFSAFTAYWKRVSGRVAYVEGCLAVDVGGVDVALVVVEQRDHVVDVPVRYRVEHDVVADLFDLANHLNYNSAIMNLKL